MQRVGAEARTVLAVLDETYPELPNGIAYVVGAAVILAEEQDARAAVANIFADSSRQNPFHWHKEGPTARRAMIETLATIGAVPHVGVHYPTGRKKLAAARETAVAALIPKLIHDGVSTLLIESRGDLEDGRDRAVILDTLNQLNQPGAFAYAWHGKSEPLLWLADGICGAVHEHLTRVNDGPLDALRAAGVVDRLDYLSSL